MLLYREGQVWRDNYGDRVRETVQVEDLNITMHWSSFTEDGPRLHITEKIPGGSRRVLCFDLHRILDYDRAVTPVLEALETLKRRMLLDDLADV